eukprot:CAMPEP_0196154042 /NCGR_PEP_ID=MMETSP0910-20130528/38246_1 /TAXON_ID=49265 /ORGANISM="Thalassiosira rotula, Strain GSO102" /LENGTH=44 /DNA_ID= /DNA_START= /DNA_END= /DNA_ORIENTATION=
MTVFNNFIIGCLVTASSLSDHLYAAAGNDDAATDDTASSSSSSS